MTTRDVSPGKEHDGAGQYAKDREHRACHGCVPVAEAWSSVGIALHDTELAHLTRTVATIRMGRQRVVHVHF